MRNAHERKKGKDHFLLKRTTSGKESRARCQGSTFHFPDMRLGQEEEGSSEVRASAAPPGTPLPGGRKSMWFLSYLWEGVSPASTTDLQRAAERRKKADAEDENALTPLPLPSHGFSEAAPANMCARVSLRKPKHTRLSAGVRRHVPQQPVGRCRETSAASRGGKGVVGGKVQAGL